MKYLQVLLFALLSICAQSLPAGIDKGDHILVCRGALDLGIIFDVSRSIHSRDFIPVKNGLIKFLKQFTIGPKYVRVGLIPFENEIHTDYGFTLDQFNNTADIVKHMTDLPLIGAMVQRHTALTETYKALIYVRETLLSSAVTREGIPRVCLVMTDGNSQNGSETVKEAKALRETGVQVYAVGFGKYVKKSELINIAGDESRVKLERNFGNLDSIMADLSVDVCEKIPKKKEPVCTERDIVVAFSRAQLGGVQSDKAVDLVEALAQITEHSTGFRWGVASGVCPKDAGFGLGTDVTENLKHYRKAHLTAIVDGMTTNSPYSSSRIASQCNMAVLVVNEFGLDDLQANVEKLRHLTAEPVFVWNLSGIDVTNVVGNSATVISGLTVPDPQDAAKNILQLITTEL